MKKTIVYIVCIVLLFLFLYWLNRSQPQYYTWEPTYDTTDKQPYGAYALDKLLKASWKEGYTHCYKSISDLKEEGKLEGRNLLIITQDFETTKSDEKVLLEYIREGGTALIAARTFPEILRKRLKAWVNFSYHTSDIAILMGVKRKFDTLHFCTPGLDHEKYKIPSMMCSLFFVRDSLDKVKDSVFIVAKANNQQVIMLRYPIGKGSLLLSCNPLIYTNYSILSDSCNMFLWNSFAYLQGKPLIRTEYYHA